MKKLLLLFLTLALSFSIAACTDEEDPVDNGDNGDNGNGEERSNPVISGTEDATVFLNDEFDPMEGISAVGHDGEDLTDEINIIGSVDTEQTGVSYLRYRVEDEYGNFTEAARYITVDVDPDSVGDEMVPNGDFSLDMSFWSTTTGIEGGTGDFNVVDGELVIDVHSTSGGMWEPRLENIGITFEQGTIYELSFDARAEEPRAIHAQVGEILDDSPWFLNFKPAVPGVVDLTTEMETYTLTFMMDEDTNTNGAVIFEFGNVAGDVGTDNLLTTVYLDNVVVKEVDEFVDDVPPVISGADDTVITIGDDFDPLDGVEVIDNVDGEITLTNDHVSGTVDVDELGDYTLTYTVSDEAGNVTEVNRIITVAEPDEETEIGADYGWRMFLNDWDGTAGSMDVVDGELALTVDNANISANWNVQIIQDTIALNTSDEEKGEIELEAGKTYRVTFDARSSVEGEGSVLLGHSPDSWVGYMTETFTVTEDMQTFSFEITLDDDDLDYSTEAMFKFELGDLFADIDDSETFTVDNIMLEVKDDDDVFVDTEQIINGSFELVDEKVDLTYGWRPFANTWEGSDASLSVVDGQLVFDVDAINTWENWQLQIIQDKYAMDGDTDNEGSMDFVADESYRVTFDAKASVDGEATLQIGHDIDGWLSYYNEPFNVTGEMQTFTFEFTLDDSEIDYSDLAQFKIEMGMLFSGEDAPQSFTLDNVVIERLEDEDYIDTELVVNGDFSGVSLKFEEAYGWRPYANTWDGSDASLSVVDEQLVFNVDAINTWENWQLQIIQDNFALDGEVDNEGSLQFEAGESYRVSFDAKASVDGEATLQIGHDIDGWLSYYNESFDVTGEMQTFTFDFELDDSEIDYSDLAQFKIEMGMLFSGEDAPQSFTLDNVVIEKSDDNDEYADAGLIINGNFEGVWLEMEEALEILPTPFGIVENENEIVWGAIEEADGFLVYIDGEEASPYSVDAGFYAFNLTDLALDAGTYEIQIQALGDGETYDDSELTEVHEYVVE